MTASPDKPFEFYAVSMAENNSSNDRNKVRGVFWLRIQRGDSGTTVWAATSTRNGMPHNWKPIGAGGSSDKYKIVQSGSEHFIVIRQVFGNANGDAASCVIDGWHLGYCNGWQKIPL